MIRDILGTSRFLIILAVLGTFIASATLQVFGLLRVVAVIIDLIRAGDVSSAAAKCSDRGHRRDHRHLPDRDGPVRDLGRALPALRAARRRAAGWLKIESLDDLKDNLTEVIVVALLVAFLGQAVEWTGDIESSASGSRSGR